MTHVEGWASALVDGRLRPDVAERAHVHLAGCPRCRQAVAAEREVARRLRDAPVPAPSDQLVERLLALGGPQGPFAPAPLRVPGAPDAVPAAAWTVDTAGTPAVDSGRARRHALPVAVGALSLVSLGLLGILLIGTTWTRPAQEAGLAAGAAALDGAGGIGTDEQLVAAGGLDAAECEDLRGLGWVCPEALPGGLRLVDARVLTADGVPVLHATYSDGTSMISLVERQGELEAADPQALARAVGEASRDDDARWQGLWQSGDVVVAVIADASPQTVARVLPALLSDG